MLKVLGCCHSDRVTEFEQGFALCRGISRLVGTQFFQKPTFLTP